MHSKPENSFKTEQFCRETDLILQCWVLSIDFSFTIRKKIVFFFLFKVKNIAMEALKENIAIVTTANVSMDMDHLVMDLATRCRLIIIQ